jgi:hypothetical protein
MEWWGMVAPEGFGHFYWSLQNLHPSGLVLVKKLGKNRDSIFSRCWLTVNKKISWAILAAIVPPMLDATQDGPSTSFHWFRGLEQGSKCANLRSQVEYPGNPNSIYLEISFL